MALRLCILLAIADVEKLINYNPMNAFDYFFEKTSTLEKSFLAGKEVISFKTTA